MLTTNLLQVVNRLAHTVQLNHSFSFFQGMINYFLKLKVKPQDVASLMQFIATVHDENVLKETFDLMHGLCKGPTKVPLMAEISRKHKVLIGLENTVAKPLFPVNV